MNTSDALKTISERLMRENICSIPLSEKSLQIVYDFMRLRNANSELMRRLSTVELNYVQIHAEADDARKEALGAKQAVINSLKGLLDIWHRKGYLREFSFSFSEEDTSDMRADLSLTIESININLNVISRSLMTLGETSAQMRACSASFMEIYHESKLAIYAAMLNRSKEEILDCRAISLQSHASSNESNRASAHYLGIAKQCTRIISTINALIAEISSSLYTSSSASYTARLFFPNMVTNKLSDAIRNLEYINIESN